MAVSPLISINAVYSHGFPIVYNHRVPGFSLFVPRKESFDAQASAWGLVALGGEFASPTL